MDLREKLFVRNRVSTFSTDVPNLTEGDDSAARNYLSWLRIADARPQDDYYFARLLQREQ